MSAGKRIAAGFNTNPNAIMNEIIASNGGVLLNPSGIRKHFHVLTQGVGIRLDPVLSCMDPAGIEATVPRNCATDLYFASVSLPLFYQR